MPDKGLGFIRNIRLTWLDAAAESRLRNEEMKFVRADLEQFLKTEIEGAGARRKTIDVLIGIWHKTASVDSSLHEQALFFYPAIQPGERVWLHYGLALLYYPFFRQTAAVIGQFARTGEPVTRAAVKNRLAAEIGHLGSLNRAAERIVASLVDWGILAHQKKGNLYLPQLQAVKSDNQDLQCWLLACALSAHPSDQLPFSDLMRLPELFSFKVTIGLDHLRSNAKFNIHRQGIWDMLTLK